MRMLLLLALISVAAQQPPDESNIPDSEKRIPQGDYCKRADVGITKSERRAHACSCVYSCHVDEQGNVVEAESPDCLAYCAVHGRRCSCWPEGDGKTVCEGGPIADADPILVSPAAADLRVAATKTLPGHTAERNIRINGRRYRLQFVAGRWRAVRGTGAP